jgi:serine-type D-Ala-D-Ala carboxypeptidase/endopeptidase (penicillin-binding protein 4)
MFFLPSILPIVAITAPADQTSSVIARIEKILSISELKHGIVGVCVRSLDSKKTLYSKNPDTSLMPASNRKIVTAAAALGILGPEFRYKTSVFRSGEDLVLKGSGDPSLDFARLQKLAEAIKAAGVTEVKGRLLGDATRFDDERLGDGWQWDDEPFYYSAQISGLNCDENVVSVRVQPGEKAGDPARITTSSGYASVLSTVVTTADKEAKLSFDRRRGHNELVVSGTIALTSKGQSEALTIEDPAIFALHRFSEALRNAGVIVPEDTKLERGTASTNAEPAIATSESAPLSELIKQFLKDSDNLYGECFFKTLSASGTVSAAQKALVDWLKSRGISPEGVVNADGSGLSRMNLVTARFISELLVDRASDLNFYNGLPIGGVDGTLKNRFKNTAAQRIVRAKTGTLTGASSLSGYLVTRSGERVVFSILMNNYERVGGASVVRAAQDALVLALFDWPKK